MPRGSSLALALVLALAGTAGAGLNKNYLVPVYEACPGSGNCFPAKLASTYTYESIILYSSQKPYTGPEQFALAVSIKGLKDASGNLVTGVVELRIPAGRTTILTGIGTFGETSPLAETPPYRVEVTNGSAKKKKFFTPDVTPEHGLIVNSFGAPVLYDPDGKPLASTGTRSKP